MCFSDIDRVIRRANGTEFGLAAGVFSKDVSKVLKVAEKIQAGTVSGRGGRRLGKILKDERGSGLLIGGIKPEGSVHFEISPFSQVFVNTYQKTDVAAPFGGFKQSGFGKDLGQLKI